MKILTLILLCSNLFASDCLSLRENHDYPLLDWVKVVDSHMTSSVENIDGTFCIGFAGKELKRMHYSDQTGNIILKSSKELLDRDVIFFSRSLLPSFVQKITRKIDPLSIGITRLSSSEYFINIKFVENLLKGFGKTRVRLLKVKLDYTGEQPELYVRQKKFNKFSISITNTLKLKRLFFFEDNKRVLGFESKYLARSRRR